jgi:hypothetical protein
MANPPVTIGPFTNVPAPGSGVKSDWPQQISTYVAPTAWTAPAAFTNGWVQFGSTYQNVQYRKVGDMVQIRGACKGGTVSSAIFTLPAGFRPPADLQFGNSSSSTPGTFLITAATGVVSQGQGNAAFCALVCTFSVTP